MLAIPQSQRNNTSSYGLLYDFQSLFEGESIRSDSVDCTDHITEIFDRPDTFGWAACPIWIPQIFHDDRKPVPFL